MSPDVFVIGTVQVTEADKLHAYFRYYLDAGIPADRILLGIHAEASADTSACAAVAEEYGIHFCQELSTEDSAAEWRQNVQDEYIQDEDWVVHANAGDLVHIPWAGNDFVLAAEWMDEHQFDAVAGRVITRYMRTHPVELDKDTWYWHVISVDTANTRMAMTRGYWYTCDDGSLCPEFCDSVWVLDQPVEIHQLTYQVLEEEGIDHWRITPAAVD